ncbi:MAG: hypothetical protein HY650_05315 [Acidobacteria bacterium]|nr:hypothetical protein [Acidobacteriota bacterium]
MFGFRTIGVEGLPLDDLVAPGKLAQEAAGITCRALNQIPINPMNNAIKFTERGSVRFSIPDGG